MARLRLANDLTCTLSLRDGRVCSKELNTSRNKTAGACCPLPMWAKNRALARLWLRQKCYMRQLSVVVLISRRRQAVEPCNRRLSLRKLSSPVQPLRGGRCLEVCVFCHRRLQLTAVSGKNLSGLLERKLSIEGPVSRSLVLADLSSGD